MHVLILLANNGEKGNNIYHIELLKDPSLRVTLTKTLQALPVLKRNDATLLLLFANFYFLHEV